MIYSEEEGSNISESINIKVKQQILLNHKISVIDYFLLKEIFELKKTNSISSATYFSISLPAIFPSRRSARSALGHLVEKSFLEKTRAKDLLNFHTFQYSLTEAGKAVLDPKLLFPNYSNEEYLRAVAIIDVWNEIKETSSHKIKSYGEDQTKTITTIIRYVNDLIVERKLSWYPTDILVKNISLQDITETIKTFQLKFSEKYKPVSKTHLPKSLVNFFCHYQTKHSEFFNVFLNGVEENVSTVDRLKKTGITPALLRKAYATLSESGVATESEKLSIQKNLIVSYKKYSIHKEVELDVLYSWNKNYIECVAKYNVFLHNFLTFISNEVGKGNAKSGYISFNKTNKIMEAYSKWITDKYNIFLFPTKLQVENIMKSKIVK